MPRHQRGGPMQEKPWLVRRKPRGKAQTSGGSGLAKRQIESEQPRGQPRTQPPRASHDAAKHNVQGDKKEKSDSGEGAEPGSHASHDEATVVCTQDGGVGSSMQTPLPKLIDQWRQLSNPQQAAAALLGFTSETWPAPEHLRVFGKMWIELSEHENRAAQTLGYSSDIWDEAGSTASDESDEEEGYEPPLPTNSGPGNTAGNTESDSQNVFAARLARLNSHADWRVAEREQAASKLQAFWRGKVARKKYARRVLPPTSSSENKATKPDVQLSTGEIAQTIGVMGKALTIQAQEELVELMEEKGRHAIRDQVLINFLEEQLAKGIIRPRAVREAEREAKQRFGSVQAKEKARQKASVTVQANFRGYICRKRRKQSIKLSIATTQITGRVAGRLKRKITLSQEERRRHAATSLQASFRGHRVRLQRRRAKLQEYLNQTTSHVPGHHEDCSVFQEFIHKLAQTTVDEKIVRDEAAQQHTAGIAAAAIHDAACNVPWLTPHTRAKFRESRARKRRVRPHSALLPGKTNRSSQNATTIRGRPATAGRLQRRRSSRSRPASAFARSARDVVLNLDRTSDAVQWAAMNRVKVPPMLTPLGNIQDPSVLSKCTVGENHDLSDQNSSQSLGVKLCNSAWTGDIDGVCKSLWAGADVNSCESSGSTALILAVTAGHAEVVELLLGCGADTTCCDRDGRTALQLAAQYGRLKCIDLLHVAEADINAASDADGLTAFHLACVAGHIEVIQVLLKHGADPNAKTRSGLTGAMLVAEKQEQERQKREQVLRMLKSSDIPKEGETQTDLQLLIGDNDTVAEEARKLRVKVELAEFKDDFRSVKTDMLGMKRQMSGMIEQMNMFSGAINDLSMQSQSQVAAVVRMSPPGVPINSLRPQSAAPLSVISQAGNNIDKRPKSAAAKLGFHPHQQRSLSSASTTGDVMKSDAESTLSRHQANFSDVLDRPRSAAAASNMAHRHHIVGLERPQLPPRPHSALSVPSMATSARQDSDSNNDNTRKKASSNTRGGDFRRSSVDARPQLTSSSIPFVDVDISGISAAKDEESTTARRESLGRPLSTVIEGIKNEQSSLAKPKDVSICDDGDVEFGQSGQTVTDVLALADRNALLEDIPSIDNDWNDNEMARLDMAVGLKGEEDWENVANLVGSGRSASECRSAWQRNRDRYTAAGHWVGYTPAVEARIAPDQGSSANSTSLHDNNRGDPSTEQISVEPQTRSELIQRALARDCTHDMRGADKNVAYADYGGEWYCDSCGEQNPTGRLFQCKICKDYDLCVQCMRAAGRATESLIDRMSLGGTQHGNFAGRNQKKTASYEKQQKEKEEMRKAVLELERMQAANKTQREEAASARLVAQAEHERDEARARRRRWM